MVAEGHMSPRVCSIVFGVPSARTSRLSTLFSASACVRTDGDDDSLDALEIGNSLCVTAYFPHVCPLSILTTQNSIDLSSLDALLIFTPDER